MKSILLLITTFFTATIAFSQDASNSKIASKWMMLKRCSDPMNIFQQTFSRSTENPWSLIKEKVLANQLAIYNEENHNFQTVNYSLIPENGYVLEHNGDTLRPEPRSDYFSSKIYAYAPFKDINGYDSMAKYNGGLQFVYPPPRKIPIEWKDIEAVNIRYDLVQKAKSLTFDATYIGFHYKNATLKNDIWIKISDLKEAIKDKPFLKWLSTVEKAERFGFLYMQINSAVNDLVFVSPDNPCMKVKHRFVSVPRNEHNAVLFKVDTTETCMIKAINAYLWNSDFHSFYWPNDGDWYYYPAGYVNQYIYNHQFLWPIHPDYFEFSIESNIPLSNIDGEDSLVISGGVMEFVYPDPELYPFNLSDWNEIRIRETYDKKTDSYLPSGFSIVISKEGVSFELVRFDLEKLNKDLSQFKQYDWYRFLTKKEYSSTFYYQVPFK